MALSFRPELVKFSLFFSIIIFEPQMTLMIQFSSKNRNCYAKSAREIEIQHEKWEIFYENYLRSAACWDGFGLWNVNFAQRFIAWHNGTRFVREKVICVESKPNESSILIGDWIDVLTYNERRIQLNNQFFTVLSLTLIHNFLSLALPTDDDALLTAFVWAGTLKLFTFYRGHEMASRMMIRFLSCSTACT